MFSDTWVGDRNDYRIVDPFLPEMNEALLNYLNTGAIPSNSTD